MALRAIKKHQRSAERSSALTETTPKKRKSIFRFVLTSGVVLGVSSFVVGLQGMLYRSAYLSAFGVDAGQFPVEGGRLTLLVAFGWLEASMVVLEEMGAACLRLARESGWVLVTVVLTMLALPLIIGWIRRLGSKTHVKSWWRPKWINQWKRGGDMSQWPWQQRIIMAVVLWFASITLLPSILVVGAATVLLVVIFSGFPFESVGTRKALEFCDSDPSKLALVSYRLPEESPLGQWGVLIECSADYCALINNKSVEVIRAEHVARILPGATSDRHRYGAPDPTPRFCPDTFYKADSTKGGEEAIRKTNG